MQLLISFEFYIKNIYLFVIIFFFILIKSNKQINTTNLFNKRVVLGLRNIDPYNKNIGLVFNLWNPFNPSNQFN